MMELIIDDKRMNRKCEITSIYVRAKHEDGKWESVDIVQLTVGSLLAWLQSDEKIAINTVGILLRHGHLE